MENSGVVINGILKTANHDDNAIFLFHEGVCIHFEDTKKPGILKYPLHYRCRGYFIFAPAKVLYG